MQFKVTVQREHPPVGFSPAKVQAQVGDSVFWFNADKTAQHEPCVATAGDWVANPINPGEPSTQVNTDVAGTYNYHCAIHPSETGVLLVCTAIMVGPVGDGTSAFSMIPNPNAPPNFVVPVNTSVSWGNSDSVQHWPMPQGGSKTAWFQAAINPGDISAPVQFSVAQPVVCQCALHPSETIAFTVQAIVNIAPTNVGPAVAFSPATLQVGAGSSVTFTSTDPAAPHQPAPDSGPDTAWFANQIPPNGTGSFTFNTPGTFPYHDVLNPNMRGVITVVKV